MLEGQQHADSDDEADNDKEWDLIGDDDDEQDAAGVGDGHNDEEQGLPVGEAVKKVVQPMTKFMALRILYGRGS